MNLERLIETYPRLYHMAERGTWESIRNRGLLSASAVLDHFRLQGEQRLQFESEHRREKMLVSREGQQGIVLRDQKPMPRQRLLDALVDGTSPEEWYEIINEKVFFWVEEKRLHKLLGARAYRALEHDVLVVDSESLIRAYEQNIWLCHMNSGNTWPVPHKRGRDAFRRIADYPSKKSGRPLKSVVELVVDYCVPDISKYVVEVRRMRGPETLQLLFRR